MSTDASEIVEFRAGEIIFREKDGVNCVYIIKEGQVGIFKKTTDGEIPIAIIGSGEFLGEMALITEKTRSTTAYALSPVKLVSFSKSTFSTQFKKTPTLIQALLKGLVERLKRTDDLIRRNNITDEKVVTQIVAVQKKFKVQVIKTEEEVAAEEDEGAA